MKPWHSPTSCTVGDGHAQISIHFGVEIRKLWKWLSVPYLLRLHFPVFGEVELILTPLDWWHFLPPAVLLLCTTLNEDCHRRTPRGKHDRQHFPSWTTKGSMVWLFQMKNVVVKSSSVSVEFGFFCHFCELSDKVATVFNSGHYNVIWNNFCDTE